MNEKEFADYLQKKYGQQKGFKRYDGVLGNQKTLSINALKKKSTNITRQNSNNTSIMIGSEISPVNPPKLEGK